MARQKQKRRLSALEKRLRREIKRVTAVVQGAPTEDAVKQIVQAAARALKIKGLPHTKGLGKDAAE